MAGSKPKERGQQEHRPWYISDSTMESCHTNTIFKKKYIAVNSCLLPVENAFNDIDAL